VLVRRLAIAALFVIVTLGASSARAADPDPWFAADKAAHFGVSTGIAAGSYAGAACLFDARGHALLAAGGFTILVGVGKETADLAGLGSPSWKDLAWDGVGMVAGLAVAWGIDLLVRGVSDEHPLLARPRSRASASSPLVLTF
jgi:putative lipoprotein